MREIHYCEICGANYAELHHIVFKSECKALEDSEFNFTYLCYCHHRDHKKGAHHNKQLNKELKLRVQEELFRRLEKEELLREEIQEALELSDKNMYKLLKSVLPKYGKYNKEEIIIACMGGRLY
ncbi:hypothetical protein [Clostridium sp. HBUAS56017]|uniref:hypothetical protein n=1 Tax=Clostridium sp. HBUAS56017 TaxID=2571128 RepID=UPI001178B046|nr:hypothetical protein [Clostridium sp. HBUAS56017]